MRREIAEWGVVRSKPGIVDFGILEMISKAEAVGWIKEWEESRGTKGLFIVVHREVSPWKEWKE
jgi:hypothetical protein